MRLSADKVKEAILHTDQDVREAAVYYFANSFSSDPPIMPLVIQAIEKFGDERLQETVPGRKYDYYYLFHGIVQHSLYHGGQIALLKKARI